MILFLQEANRARVEMTRNHGELKRIKQLKRLPDLARSTRYFNLLNFLFPTDRIHNSLFSFIISCSLSLIVFKYIYLGKIDD